MDPSVDGKIPLTEDTKVDTNDFTTGRKSWEVYDGRVNTKKCGLYLFYRGQIFQSILGREGNRLVSISFKVKPFRKVEPGLLSVEHNQ